MAYPVTFSLNFIAVTIGPVGPITGYAEGDAVVMEFPNDDFERQESSDGFVIWIQKHNTVLEGMLRLGQGNPVISQLRQLHEASRNAGGILYPYSAKNLKSPDEAVSGGLIFKKRAPIKWGDTAQPVEIPFDLQPTVYGGGTLLPQGV